MTPISEKELKEKGWLQLQFTWSHPEHGILHFANGQYRIKGKIVKYMEQLTNDKINERRYVPSFAELCDRLNIIIQKIVFSETEEMRAEFVKERDDIVHDINLFLESGVKITGEMILAVCSLQLVNYAIWSNESGGRGDGEEKNYELSHGLNANRGAIKKLIQQQVGGRIDHKLNYINGAWNLSL